MLTDLVFVFNKCLMQNKYFRCLSTNCVKLFYIGVRNIAYEVNGFLTRVLNTGASFTGVKHKMQKVKLQAEQRTVQTRAEDDVPNFLIQGSSSCLYLLLKLVHNTKSCEFLVLKQKRVNTGQTDRRCRLFLQAVQKYRHQYWFYPGICGSDFKTLLW